MKFTIITKDSQSIKSTTELFFPVGSNLCGIQQSGHRPQKVELDYQELRHLINNPKYLTTIMLSLSYKPAISGETKCGV